MTILVDIFSRLCFWDFWEDLTRKGPWAVLAFYSLGALAQKANMQL